MGIYVHEHEQDLFFRDLSQEIIQNDDIARSIISSNILVTTHQAIFTDTEKMILRKKQIIFINFLYKIK